MGDDRESDKVQEIRERWTVDDRKDARWWACYVDPPGEGEDWAGPHYDRYCHATGDVDALLGELDRLRAVMLEASDLGSRGAGGAAAGRIHDALHLGSGPTELERLRAQRDRLRAVARDVAYVTGPDGEVVGRACEWETLDGEDTHYVVCGACGRETDVEGWESPVPLPVRHTDDCPMRALQPGDLTDE